MTDHRLADWDQPYTFAPDATAASIVADHPDLDPGTETGERVTIAGRLMLRRVQGKLAFGTLADHTGRIQLFAPAATTPDFERFGELHLGDWIGVTGEVMTTRRGELSVRVDEWVLLAVGAADDNVVGLSRLLAGLLLRIGHLRSEPLADVADRTRRGAFSMSDTWDKNHRYTPKEWVEQLSNDIDSGENSFVWTSIPDRITERLKAMGYDGVIDSGGKSGGVGHRVAIPFEANSVRSRFAAFDPEARDQANLLAGAAVAAPVGGLTLREVLRDRAGT